MNTWKRVPSTTRPLVLAAGITLLLTYAPSSDSKPAPIDWSPSSVDQSLTIGETGTASITFTSTRSLRKVTVTVDSTIASYVTPSPKSFSTIEKGVAYTLNLTFEVPAVTQPGVIGGTVLLEKGRTALADVLPVTLDLQQDSDSDGVPDDQDNCPNHPNPEQENTDGDSLGEACDPDPSDDDGQSESWGDPHLVTFDRLGYDFQGAGEFILSRSLTDDLEVQARMVPWGASRVASIQNAFAMNVAGDRVGVYLGRSPALYVNGEPTLLTEGMLSLSSGGAIESASDGYVVLWPDDSRAEIALKNSYLDFRLTVAASRVGQLQGLLGNFDRSRVDELITRDGDIISTPPNLNDLYGQYGESWRITQGESLFDYMDGNTTDTFTDRYFPEGFVTSASLTDAQREEAEWICAEAGIADPVLFEACVLDVGLTSDPSFANSSASAFFPADSFDIDDSLGLSEASPAKSCLEIQQNGVVYGDSKYWVELPSGVYEMHCNFSADTGGWTRVAALDTSLGYCGNDTLPDLRADPDASMGKIPDSDTQALMTGTVGSPMELMYFSRVDGRYVWHALENATDFDTSSKHTSSSFYCSDWHCDDGSTDASACGTEGDGCPVIARGIEGYYEKIYVDSSFLRHIRGLHANGNICGLPNYERASIWIYVR